MSFSFLKTNKNRIYNPQKSKKQSDFKRNQLKQKI